MAPDRRALAGRRPGLAGPAPARAARAPRALPRPGNRVLPAERLAPATGPVDARGARAGRAAPRCCCPTSTCRGSSTSCPRRRGCCASGRFDALLTTSPPHSRHGRGRRCWHGARACRGSPTGATRGSRTPTCPRPPRRAGQARRVRRGSPDAPRRGWPAPRASTRRSPTRCGDLAPGGEVGVIPNGAEVDAIAALERHPAAALTFLYAGYFFGDRGPGRCSRRSRGAARAAGAARRACGRGSSAAFPDATRAAVSRARARGRRRVEPTARTTRCCRPSATRTCCCCSCRSGPAPRPSCRQDVGVPRGGGRCSRWCRRTAPRRASRRRRRRRSAGTRRRRRRRRAILALAERHEAGTLAVPGLSPAAREQISRRGPGGASGRSAAAGSRDDRPRHPERGRPGDGVEQPVVSGRNRREHHQHGVERPDQPRDACRQAR